jgi:hypothetical protein
VPALLRALQRENERGIDKSDTSKRAILDALIVLDAQVQPGLLMQRLERTSLTETCLLLLQYKAGASDALLELFDKAPSHTKAPWAAACALVSNRDKRIAERLIAGRAWELDLKVSGLGRGGGWAYCGGDPRWHSSHENWPPKVTYDLRLPEYGAALLLIRSVRTEGTRSGLVEQGIAERERNALRIRLLNVLLGEEQERGLLRPSEDFALDVTSVEDYHRKLQDHCMDLRDRLTHVALRLEALGHLEHAQELADLIVLHIRLHDFFSEDGARLPRPPDLPWVEFEEY